MKEFAWTTYCTSDPGADTRRRVEKNSDLIWLEEARRWTPTISSKFGLPYLQVANRSVADREHEENRARDSEDAADHFVSKTWSAV